MSEDKELTPYNVDNYRMADFREKKLYWIEVYRQRAQVAENEMRRESQKLRQAAAAHDVPYLSHRGKSIGLTIKTYVGAPVLRSYCLLGAHKQCAKCERIALLCQGIRSYKNVRKKWLKKAEQYEESLGLKKKERVRNGIDE